MEQFVEYASRTPHPATVFSLIPLNDRAWSVLQDPSNRHIISVIDLPDHDPTCGINIGPHIMSQSHFTLATLGRQGDVVVSDATVSRIQCSFEINETSGSFLLQDWSSGRSTRTTGETAILFDPQRLPRRVLITPTINLNFSFGGSGGDAFCFGIFWHQQQPVITKPLHRQPDAGRDARTIEGTETVAQTQRVACFHTPNNHEHRIRWCQIASLGHGTFGQVHSGLDIDSGAAFAVKTLKLQRDGGQSNHELVKREVEMLARVSHPNIVGFIGAQPGPDESWEIFTALKHGNLNVLMNENIFEKRPQVADDLLKSIFLAVDYLHGEGIIHRDVKPANILFTKEQTTDTVFHFVLADFGLANFAAAAKTHSGSDPFWAPELFNPSTTKQTTKMDIWSFLVTIMWVTSSPFRAECYRTQNLGVAVSSHLMLQPILRLVEQHPYTNLQDMAVVDPEQRASARDMLKKLYNIDGEYDHSNALEATDA